MLLIFIIKLSVLASHFVSTQAGEPPTVAAFNFQSALKEGERGSAICTIRSGDIPLEFQWLKDGDNVKEVEGIKIQSVLDSSVLVISSVTSKSSGNYTCIVRNAFGSDRYTSTLAVTAPPTWKTEPKDIEIQENENGIIQCEAIGVPQPEIKWARGDAEKNSFISNDPSSTIKVLSNGALSFTKIEAETQGSYMCIADNNFGEPLSKTIFVKVRDAPVVAPFSFPPALREGERGNAACTVRSGEIPLEFTWLKDGTDVQEKEGIKIQSLMDSSVLSISSVTSESSGNYTCIVKNAFGSDRYTSTLAVTAPPTWKIEPKDIDTQEGENEMISCAASGVPVPEIKWISGSDMERSITTGDVNSNVKVLPNGALSLSKVEASMQGSYTCVADNKFGTPLSKTIFIKVRESPTVAPFYFPPGLKEGERGSATCTIKSGDKPFEFQWMKDGEIVRESSNIRIQSVLDTSLLIIEAVISESSGNYTCIVKNSFGSDRFTATLTVTAPPIWLKEPTDMIAEEGDSLTVDCTASGVPLPTIKWKLGDANNDPISSDPSSGIKIAPSGSLIINKVEASMKGLYTCEADNGFGKSLLKTISISVRDPPVVAPFNFPPGLKEGEQGSVTCTIRSGDRPVEFQWLKDDKEILETSTVRIQSSGDYSILLIQSVIPESSGNYTCIVKNVFGNDRYTATLTVSAPPVWMKVPRDVLVQEDESVSLPCSADGEPKPSIKWLRGTENEVIGSDSFPGMSVSSSGSLVITKVESSMQGSYTCVADNGLGKPLSQTVILSVRDAPVVAPFIFPPALREGERGTATCTIKSGDRPLQFKWLKDGTDLTLSSSIDIQSMKDSSFLVIESVTSKSSGNYTCIVSNVYGKDQFTTSLTVTAPPQWLKEPTDSVSQEGESLIIECEASGVPSPTVKWRLSSSKEAISKDSMSTLRVSETGSLIISKVEASMHGSYTCEADNGFGDPLKKEILISVRDAPVVSPFIFPPALKEGERGSVICTTRSGDRPVEFQWKKDGEALQRASNVDIQSLKDSSILKIESVTPKSSGNYTCIVTNAFGRDEYTSSLTVTAPPVWVKEPLDSIVQEGESLTIECQGSGVPLPTIKWTVVK